MPLFIPKPKMKIKMTMFLIILSKLSTKLFPLTAVYTIMAVILHFDEVGKFQVWSVTALPWHWSILCPFYVHLIEGFLIVLALFVLGVIEGIRRESVLNEYVPEQHEFIRNIMKW